MEGEEWERLINVTFMISTICTCRWSVHTDFEYENIAFISKGAEFFDIECYVQVCGFPFSFQQKSFVHVQMNF